MHPAFALASTTLYATLACAAGALLTMREGIDATDSFLLRGTKDGLVRH